MLRTTSRIGWKNKVASGDTYTLRDDGRIDVEFFFRRDTLDGKEDSWSGVARVKENTGNAHWRICFFWPFYADYMIIDRADDYSWAVIGHPSRKYFWILSRSRSIDPQVVDGIIERAVVQGYEAEKIKAIPQPIEGSIPVAINSEVTPLPTH